MLDVGLKLVTLGLLDEDLFRELHRWQVFVLLPGVLLLDGEDAQGAVKTCREERRVIIRDSKSLDWQGMSLDLEDLLVGVAEDLDRARFVLLGHTCENGTSVVHQHRLRKGARLLIPELLNLSIQLSDSFICASGVNKMTSSLLALLLVRSHASVVHVLDLVLPDGCLLAEFPHKDSGVPTTGNEACVVVQPADRSNQTRVVLELVVGRVLRRVEFVHVDVALVLAREKMSTVREYDFTALLDLQ